MTTQPHEDRLIGKVLNLQGQRLSTLNERTQSMATAIDEIKEQNRQFGCLLARLDAELRKE